MKTLHAMLNKLNNVELYIVNTKSCCCQDRGFLLFLYMYIDLHACTHGCNVTLLHVSILHCSWVLDWAQCSCSVHGHHVLYYPPMSCELQAGDRGVAVTFSDSRGSGWREGQGSVDWWWGQDAINWEYTRVAWASGMHMVELGESPWGHWWCHHMHTEQSTLELQLPSLLAGYPYPIHCNWMHHTSPWQCWIGHRCYCQWGVLAAGEDGVLCSLTLHIWWVHRLRGSAVLCRHIEGHKIGVREAKLWARNSGVNRIPSLTEDAAPLQVIVHLQEAITYWLSPLLLAGVLHHAGLHACSQSWSLTQQGSNTI